MAIKNLLLKTELVVRQLSNRLIPYLIIFGSKNGARKPPFVVEMGSTKNSSTCRKPSHVDHF